MNQRIFTIIIVTAIGLCQSTMARFSPSYTYEELVKISDVVVIMEHESTEETTATDKLGGLGRVTIAKVLIAFKGKASEKVTIHHFFYHPVPSAPNCVIFPPALTPELQMQISTPNTKGTVFIRPARQYIAFLKIQADGSYIPATPPYDSNLSFLPIGNDLSFLYKYPIPPNDHLHEKQSQEVRLFIEKSEP